jgi:quercetin dioxygenase-like cupin family protein
MPDGTVEDYLKPYLLPSGDGVAPFGPSVKASGLSTGGALTVIESKTRGGAPWHVHSREDEYFYVVEGAIVVHCGEETYIAGPRSFVCLPRGIPHAWDVEGESATLLMMTVPAMLEEFLQELHAATTADGRDVVAANYGIEFLRDR